VAKSPPLPPPPPSKLILVLHLLVHVSHLLVCHLVFQSIFTVGYEFIYDFIHHVLGEPQKFSGIAIHLGHYIAHFCSVSGCRATQSTFRKLLQTGVCLWMQSSTQSMKRCCDLKFIGGDGTLIGIPIKNVPSGLKPVWQPKTLLPNSNLHSRPTREALCDVFSKLCFDEGNRLRDKLKQIINCSSEPERFRYSIEIGNEFDTIERYANEFFHELKRWLQLPIISREFKPMKFILQCIISKASVTGCFPYELSRALITQQGALRQGLVTLGQLRSWCAAFCFHGCGLGIEVIEVFSSQVQHSGNVCPSTVNMVLYFGKLLYFRFI
jgi:hypothetical protein